MNLRKLQKLAILTGLGLGAFVALVGIAHTPVGRPLLGVLGILPGCPVSLDKVDPVRAEAFRRLKMRENAGPTASRALPAAGFELGMSRPRVEAWLQEQGARCEPERTGSVIACSRVEQTNAAAIRNLHLQFDAHSRLVAVDLFRDAVCGNDALRHLRSVEARLAEEVGPVTGRQGKATGAYLEAGRFHRVASQFKYANYAAELSAMGDGAGGVRVRESYQWLPAEPS